MSLQCLDFSFIGIEPEPRSSRWREERDSQECGKTVLSLSRKEGNPSAPVKCISGVRTPFEYSMIDDSSAFPKFRCA